MKTAKIQINLRLLPEDHAKIVQVAKFHRASFNHFVEGLVLQAIRKHEREHGPISTEEQN
nr:MAG TPA: hypothetical protein [Caudoviricetes sp.]